jgi:hypothetical protein
LTLSVVPLLLCSAGFVQAQGHKMDPPSAGAPKSEAQISFEAM